MSTSFVRTQTTTIKSHLQYTLKVDEQLYLYLGVFEVAVSGGLVREEESAQFPSYYVSITLGESESRYPHLEKIGSRSS